MADETASNEAEQVENVPPGERDEGPGGGFVPAAGIVILAAILFVTAAITVYSLIQLWPVASNESEPQPSPSKWLMWTVQVSNETRLFLVVLAAGALGGLAHSVRSLYWYVGNRQLYTSWTLMYLSLPGTGAGMALLTYLVLRGGLTTSVSTSADLNPYGLAAISALVGLFSRQAVEKLKVVFETLLTPAEKGKDSIQGATIVDFSPPTGSVGDPVTLSGTGFMNVSQVKFGSGTATGVTPSSDLEITLKVPHGAQTGPISVIGPAGRAMSADSFTVLPTVTQ